MTKLATKGCRSIFPAVSTKDEAWGPLYGHTVSNAAECYMRARMAARKEVWLDRALEYLVNACALRWRVIRKSYEKALVRVSATSRLNLAPYVERLHVQRLRSVTRTTFYSTGSDNVLDIVVAGGGHSGEKHRVNLNAVLLYEYAKLCDCESNLNKSG